MNFNNLKERLELINIELDENSKIPLKLDLIKNHNVTDLKFTSRTESQSRKDIMALILYISTLKDLIKNELKKNNLNPNIIDHYINQDLRLCVLMDLNNKIKHGEPSKYNRSNLNPRITKETDGMRVSLIDSKPTIKPIIHADVVDENDNLICTFQQLINHSLMKFDKFIDTYKL